MSLLLYQHLLQYSYTTKPKLQPVHFGLRCFSGMLIPEQLLREMPKNILVTCMCKERCSNCCSCKRQEQVSM